MPKDQVSADVVFAAAQSLSVAGDIASNVQRHLRFMEVAAQQGVSFLMFPELSLTGYEPGSARELALAPDDSRLQPLQSLARELGIVTVVGAPVQSALPGEVLIAALVLGISASPRLYTKQHLHTGEERVFSPGSGGAPVIIGTEQIGLAVCADFSRPEHARKAAEAGAAVYAASVLISGPGYETDAGLLSGHARKHQMAVLMANHAGTTGGWQSNGRSALWSERGELVAEIAGAEEGLLLVRRTVDGWAGCALAVPV